MEFLDFENSQSVGGSQDRGKKRFNVDVNIGVDDYEFEFNTINEGKLLVAIWGQ